MARACAALLLAVVGSAAHAAEDQCDTFAALTPWIAEWTPYPVTDLCPPVITMHFPDSGGPLNQAAAYSPATGRIGLAPDLDTAHPLGQSYLLHELVHAYQFLNGKTLEDGCAGGLELEAYTVQAAFLRDHGLSREATITYLMGMMQSCPGTH